MAPRMMVVCLGGLAGAGALVCCDMDDGLWDEAPESPDAAQDGVADTPIEVAADAESEEKAVPIH